MGVHVLYTEHKTMFQLQTVLQQWGKIQVLQKQLCRPLWLSIAFSKLYFLKRKGANFVYLLNKKSSFCIKNTATRLQENASLVEKFCKAHTYVQKRKEHLTQNSQGFHTGHKLDDASINGQFDYLVGSSNGRQKCEKN